MKYFVILVLIAISVFSNAQTTIKMEKDAGIYKVRCKVNGAPMKMYFDTGATVVSISRATAIYLYDNDLINEDDFIGKMNTTTAEGAIADNMLIRLKDVEFGGLHLKDVEAVVSSSLNAPLLLGQSVISRLGKITLDGDLLTIHSSNTESLSNEQRNELDNRLKELRANRFKDRDVNYKILDIISKIEKTDILNEYELFCKLMSESNENKNDEAIRDAETWIEKYAIETDSIDLKMRTYFVSAKANLLSDQGDKELGMERLSRCSSYFINDTTEHFFWSWLPSLQYEYCKFKNKGFMDAVIATKATITHFLKAGKISITDINQNKYQIPQLGNLFHALESCYVGQYNWLDSNNKHWSGNQVKMLKLCAIMSAKLGNPIAIDTCNECGFDYKKSLTRKELDYIGISEK